MSYPKLKVLGVMSGTSGDGIDGIVAELMLSTSGLHWNVVARASQDFDPDLHAAVHAGRQPETSNVHHITELHTRLGRAYADFCQSLTAEHPCDLIALSGQTVYHIPRIDPSRHWLHTGTLQLGESAYVAERCRVPVYSDFRAGDMAAGGQGAPLVACADYYLYHQPGTARAVHNLGGISNLTYLPADTAPEQVFAFDTGPANCLLDDCVQHYFHKAYDQGGKLSACGIPNLELLQTLTTHYQPYLHLPPPKTTGRELFNLQALHSILQTYPQLNPYDLLATLTLFSAYSIVQAYERFVLPKGLDDVLVAGGGSNNQTLMRHLRVGMAHLGVLMRPFRELGWHDKDREALAFAVLGYLAHLRLPNIFPQATGAQRAAVVGKCTLA